MTTKTQMGRYRYWGDRQPDTSRPLLTFTRPRDAVPLKSSGVTAPDGTQTSVGTIRIYGPIDAWGGYWGVSAKEVATALDLLGDVDQLVIRINSPGGDSFEGRAIMNAFRAHPAQCTAIVDGLAASAASYIAVGCDETVMAPGTAMMIHDTHTIIYGNADELRKQADVIDSISKSGAELYADVAGGSVDEWRQMQRDETWFTAAEAVEAKLADRVGIVPDLGPVETAGDGDDEDEPMVLDPDEDDRARAAYDLSIFTSPGREKAPAQEPPSAPAVGSTETEGGSAVAFSDDTTNALRDKFGLAEDADDAAVLAAADDLLEKATEPTSKATTSTKAPEGMVLVEQEIWETTKTDAAAGRGAADKLAEQERDSAIAAAIAAGKTTPARKAHWEKSWAADMDGTKALLDSLEPGLVPVTPIGHSEETTTDIAPEDAAELGAFVGQFGLTMGDLNG